MAIRSNRIAALLIMLGTAVVVGKSVPIHAEDQMITLNPQTLKWIAIPNMPPCSTAAVLRGNPRWGPAWVLLRLASGCQVPWHWHTANETLLVISGRGTVTAMDGPPLVFVPGAFSYLPSHHAHRASCSRTCVLFNSADAAFDIHYVGANGQEISSEEALRPAPRPAPRHRGKRK
jgi:mannose-6-phosphate isomerase-like protein (cupin superfamily)